MSINYKGIFTALATPFSENGSVNECVLRRLTDYNIDVGVSGLFVCGSSAEAFLLSIEERKLIMKAVAEQAAGRTTLIAHVGHPSTSQARELGRYARELGYHAVSAVAPFYHKVGFGEIKEHFFSIADASELPLLVYNIPAFTGVTFTLEELSELLSDKRIFGMKHTSGDYMLLRQLKTAYPDKFIFNGYDETFLCGLVMGADGAIGSNFNFMADKFIEIYKLFMQREIVRAMRLQEQATKMLTVIMEYGLSPSIKVLLKEKGFDCGACRPPFKKMTPEQEKELVHRIEKIEKETQYAN